LIENKTIVYGRKREISHPKAMFDKSFKIMDWYIKFMKKEYDADFIGFDDMGVGEIL